MPLDTNPHSSGSPMILPHDVEVARSAHRAMVPQQLPSAEGLDIAALFRPSDAIGGDIYDIVRVSKDMLGIFMFDVSAKGVSSALIAAITKVSFLKHLRTARSPRALMSRVNADMVRRFSSMHFIAAFAAYLDLHSNRLTYCNAGHVYPLVYGAADGALKPLRTAGLFLGLFDDGLYEEDSMFLHPGDWLVVFSNGVYAAFDAENEIAGRRELEQTIAQSAREASPRALIDTLSRRTDEMAEPLADDISVVAAQVLTESRRNLLKTKLGFLVGDPVYLQFINYFEEMDKATSVILKEMDVFGYPDGSIRKMKISLTELLANAIYHGNGRDNTRCVTIGHLADKNCVTVSIMDEGEGFDYNNIPDPTLPENLEKDCGRGLFIVKNYVDGIEFNPDGNRVTIRKYRGGKE